MHPLSNAPNRSVLFLRPKKGWKGLRVNEETEILQRLTRVETKLDLMITARDIAQEALQSTKAAHHRLDEMRSSQKWLIGTTISVVALFLTAIGILLKH